TRLKDHRAKFFECLRRAFNGQLLEEHALYHAIDAIYSAGPNEFWIFAENATVEERKAINNICSSQCLEYLIESNMDWRSMPVRICREACGAIRALRLAILPEFHNVMEKYESTKLYIKRFIGSLCQKESLYGAHLFLSRDRHDEERLKDIHGDPRGASIIMRCSFGLDMILKSEYALED
ncbi:hypothetical protein PFISCL1PPCAC_11116, partial [Pristionchus fissidentatus]